MRTFLKHMLIVAPLFVWGTVAGQSFKDPITVGISKPKKINNQYFFNNEKISQISIKSTGPQKKTYTGGEIAQDIVNDILTQAFGGFLTTGSVRDMEWELKGKLVSNNDNLNWDVLLFCKGEFEKEKERIKNEDGSTSVETTKWMYVYWDEGATGVILEKEVPIGKFGVFTHPRRDSLIFNTYREAFADKFVPVSTTSQNRFYIESINSELVEYAVLGVFRDEQFTLIANGESRRMWFYLNNKLVWVFKTDVDQLPIRKKDRVMPVLEIASNLPEEQLQDWIRMAMVSRYLTATVSQSTYSK